MKYQKIILRLGLLAAILGALGFCWPWYFGHEPVLRLHGTVEVQEVRLSSKVGGRVAKVAVAEGDLVEAGQLLVYFAVPELEAQREGLLARLAAAEAELTKAKNGSTAQEKAAALAAVEAAHARLARLRSGYRAEEIEQAKSELEALEAELERARKEVERERPLYTSGVVTPAQHDATRATCQRLQGQANAARARRQMLEAGNRLEEIAEAEAEWKRASANYERLQVGTRSEDIQLAEARVNELKAKVRELDVLLSEAIVRAPEKAVVEVVAARPGDILAPNAPVVRVLRADDLWVKAYVSEVDLGKVRKNQAVEVTVDSYPDKCFEGRVVQIASVSEFTPRNVQSVDERRHQVFAIKVRVVDPDGVFKSGMAAELRLPPSDDTVTR